MTGVQTCALPICLAAVRQFHTYQQGTERFLSRTKKLDFYDPVFSNIGEQPVYTRELYQLRTQESTYDNIFGYNEAWADYRYRPGRITGALRSSAGQSLDIWHLGDNFASAPVLGSEFIHETNTYLNRCLSAPSSTIPNFIFDFFHDFSAIRVIPTYSTPGLGDHH